MRQLNTQRGMTLISLMVGTVLSMLTILAVLALYKNLIQVSVTASQDAKHDGGLASALLTAQMELSSAGFGLDENASTLIHLPSGTTAILWRYKALNATQVSCSGLLLRPQPGKEADAHTLTLLHKADCSTALNSLSVANSDSDLQASWGTAPSAITNLASFAPSINLSFESTETNCSNYGIGNGTPHPQITIKASNSASVAALKTAYNVCLANIAGASGGHSSEET